MNIINYCKCFPKNKVFHSLVPFDNEKVIFCRLLHLSGHRTNVNTFYSSLPSTFHLAKCFPINTWISSVLRSPKTRVSQINTRTFFESSGSGADINTSVSKDVVIFEYKNERFFTILKYFGLSQIFVWGYLADTAYRTLVDSPVEPLPHRELQWFEKINLGENWIRNGITLICALMGVSLCFLSYTLCVRTVKQIILHRGGREITIQNYAFFGRDSFRVPLKWVSCSISRTTKPTHLPLKVKGRRLYFTLDGKGTYPHPELFEWTAGLKRNL